MTSEFKKITELKIKDFVNVLPIDEQILGQEISQGLDSWVYKSPDSKSVYKYYEAWGNSLSAYSKIKFYQTVTASAEALVRIQNWTLETPTGSFPITVNPIENLYRSPSRDCIVGVSKFISGPHLTFAPEQQKLGFSMYVPPSLSEALYDLSDKLNSELGVTGISLCPINVKPVKTDSSYEICITDLCGRIKYLNI